jgi:hypothetical protein
MIKLISLWDFLDGKKSIIGSTVIGFLVAMAGAGVFDWDAKWFQILGGVVAAITGVSFRSAISKS